MVTWEDVERQMRDAPLGKVDGYQPECGDQFGNEHPSHRPRPAPGAGCGYRRPCLGYCACEVAPYPHRYHGYDGEYLPEDMP